MKRVWTIVVVVLVVVILLSLCCCSPAYVPYSKGSSYALYEGMDNEEQQGGNTAVQSDGINGGGEIMLSNSELPVEQPEGFSLFGGNLATEGLSVSDFLGVGVNSVAKKEGLGGLTDFLGVGSNLVAKTEGFVSPSLSPSLVPSALTGPGGLFPTGASAVYDNLSGRKLLYPSHLSASEKLDLFSEVKSVGVNGQNGCQSSGLSNSRGELCLPPELIKMLQTRGGNA